MRNIPPSQSKSFCNGVDASNIEQKRMWPVTTFEEAKGAWFLFQGNLWECEHICRNGMPGRDPYGEPTWQRFRSQLNLIF
jgi:hypothetical protein